MWQRHGKQTVFVFWLLGTLVVLRLYLKRYFSLIAHTPLGSVPESAVWKKEWCEAVDTISARKNVHFRVTDAVGPLLCFVPFVYLVLVPKVLWTRLSGEDRLAILRHELAHLKHGDLWKNLLIRILALPQWFNPLAWLAVRRFEEAGEWACDEMVVASSGFASTGYANTLLRVADFSANTPCGAVAASGGLLTRRITRLLSSSNKEVSKMKNLALLLLLLMIAALQAIRIKSVHAEQAVGATSEATRAAALANWHAKPYAIEPPDVVFIELKWEDFDAIVDEKAVSGNTSAGVTLKGIQSFQQEKDGTRYRAREFCLRGKYLVQPNGKLTIEGFDKIFIAGLTIEQASKAIAKSLSKRFGLPEVTLDIVESNSKVVYVVTKQASGDYVARIPYTGRLTVLDALASTETKTDAIGVAYVLSPYGPNDSEVRLNIDLKALRSKDSDSANLEVLPGDRIFVHEKNLPDEKSSPPLITPPTEARVSSSFYGVQEFLYEPARSPDGKLLICVRSRTPLGQMIVTTTKTLPDFANPKSADELAAMLREQQEPPRNGLRRWAEHDAGKWVIRPLTPGDVVPEATILPIVSRDEFRELNGLPAISSK